VELGLPDKSGVPVVVSGCDPPLLNPRIFTSRFTPYRCTEFVTYTVTAVFAVGYAFSALLAPLRDGETVGEAERDRLSQPWLHPAPGSRSPG
jgi:hypothetical protein